MRNATRRLVALVAGVVLLVGAAGPAAQEERPLPPPLLEAETALITKDIRAFKEWRDFKVTMREWGRYELIEEGDGEEVSDEEEKEAPEPDLVFFLTDYVADNVWQGAAERTTDTSSGTTSRTKNVYLIVYDGKTGQMLWGAGRPRLEQGVSVKRSAAKTLVQNLKNRVEEAAEKLGEQRDVG